VRRYGSIDEIAKEYALTNEQLLDYLLSNDIDAISDLDKIDLNNKNIMAILDKINRNKKVNNHNNLTSLKSIEIKGLFGKYNYLINFRDDISIWVSENGIGKTTILNIIVAILTCDQNTLMDINFKKVIVNISRESYQIDREQYFQVNSDNNRYSKRIEELLKELSMYVPRSYSIKLRNDFEHKKYIDLEFIEELSYRFFNNDVDLIKDKKIMYILHELKELQYKDLSSTLYKIKEALEERGGYYVDTLYDDAEPTDKEFFSYHAATMLSMANKVSRGDEFLLESFDNNLLVIDELSMIDVVTMSKFLSAILDDDGNLNMQVVFVGDPDQLPAIGAGQVLKDILLTDIYCSKLTTNFRAKDIPSLANNWDTVNQGDYQKLLFTDDSFRWGSNVEDYSTLKTRIESDYDSFIRDGLDPVDAKDVKHQVGFDPTKTIILTPTNAFVNEINKSLQEKYNGENKNKKLPTATDGSQAIYLYDRVMMTTNFNTEEFSYHTYDNGYYCVNGYDTKHDHLNKKNGKGIYNGDVGYIFDIDYEDKYVGFETDDGRRFWLSPEKYQNLQLAYALTIHKSQGSEYKNVLLALPQNLMYMNGFLSRNLIYTGITRAKQKVRLYGSESVLKAALENPERERRTLLKEFYSQSLESKKNEENNEQEPDDIE